MFIPEPYRQAMTRPGELIQLGPGQYLDGNTNNYLAPNVTVRGAGMDGPNETRLVNGCYTESKLGCAWQTNDGVLFEDIALECGTFAGQQNQVFGIEQFGWQPSVLPNILTRLNRVALWGRSYALYFWAGNASAPPRCKVTSSRITAAIIAVMAGQGSGPTAQYIDLYDTDIVIDYDLYPSAGVGSNFVAGLCARGGVVRMFGGSITVKGSAKMHGAAGSWTSSFPGLPWLYDWPTMELYGVTCRVEPNSAVEWYDALGDVGRIKIYGGTGSGPGGKWITKGNVSVQ